MVPLGVLSSTRETYGLKKIYPLLLLGLVPERRQNIPQYYQGADKIGPNFNTRISSFFQTASSSGDPHVHIIREVQAEDEGLYTCIAGNVLGHSTTSAYLQVNLLICLTTLYISTKFACISCFSCNDSVEFYWHSPSPPPNQIKRH